MPTEYHTVEPIWVHRGVRARSAEVWRCCSHVEGEHYRVFWTEPGGTLAGNESLPIHSRMVAKLTGMAVARSVRQRRPE